MQNLRLRITTIALTASLAAVSLLPVTASAASNSLGVNPRRDYTIKSGEKKSDTVFVSNLNKTETLNVTIELVDFGPQDSSGSPKLLLNQKQQTRWSLKPYFTIIKETSIAPGKTSEIPFTIAIPANVGAGSFYGAIKYSTGGASAKDSVSLTSSSATLIFVRVPGEANDAMLLKKFGAFTPDASGKSGQYGSLYAGQAPKYLGFDIINKGNVAEQPTGSIAIKNVIGKKIKIIDKANPGKNIVLIDQTRHFDVCLNPEQTTQRDSEGRDVDQTKCNGSGLIPGRYTAQLALLYGDSASGSSSHELGSQISFWYLPLWFVILAAAVILAVAGLVWFLVRKISGRGRPAFSSRR